MKIKNCANCKNWKEKHYSIPGYAECIKMRSSGGEAEDKSTFAFAEDCESYGAQVNTHAQFFCPMWCKK